MSPIPQLTQDALTSHANNVVVVKIGRFESRLVNVRSFLNAEFVTPGENDMISPESDFEDNVTL